MFGRIADVWSRARARFHRLSTREQMMAVAVVFTVFMFLFNNVIAANQDERMEAIKRIRTDNAAKLSKLKAELQVVGKRAQDEEQRLQAQENFEKANREVALLNSQINAIQSQSVNMADLVEGMLSSKHPSVKIVSLRTLQPKSLVDEKDRPDGINRTSAQAITEAAETGKGIGSVFKHGVEVELQGGYLELLAYLQDLEGTAPGVFWSNVSIKVVKYPVSSLKFTFYMLSSLNGMEMS